MRDMQKHDETIFFYIKKMKKKKHEDKYIFVRGRG